MGLVRRTLVCNGLSSLRAPESAIDNPDNFSAVAVVHSLGDAAA